MPHHFARWRTHPHLERALFRLSQTVRARNDTSVRTFDRAILTVYGVILVIGVAYGLTISVISIHLLARSFTKLSMGALASVFALGIVSLSLPSGWVNRKLTPKRTLVGSLVGYAICVLIFPKLSTFAPVAIARFFDGAFSVGVWVSCETILLFHANRTHKAFVMSLYAMALAGGYVVGPIVSRLVVPHTSTSVAFYAASGLALLASIIAAVGLPLEHIDESATATPTSTESATSTPTPTPTEEKTSTIEILTRIRNSCFATFAYGYFQASVVIFLPLFLIESKGIKEEKTIYITAFFAAGMLLFSNPAARVGDRVGHLLVMRTLGAIGTAMVASFVLIDRFELMCAAVFVAGATLASISPVSLALQGVVTEPRNLSRANAFYNAFYAIGMLVGPPLSGLLFTRYGGPVTLYHLTALFAAFVLFTWVFAADDPAYRRRRVPSLTEEQAQSES
jgi:MFS family permease